MTGFGLRKNTVFEWDDTVYRIDRLQPNGRVLLERINDGHFSIVEKDTLLRDYGVGRITASSMSINSVIKDAMVFSRPLDELPERTRSEVIRRRHYIQRILEDGPPVFTKHYLQPLIDEVSLHIDDPCAPSAVTLWRWYRRYRTTQDTRALIPRHDRRGSRNLRQSSRVLQLASEAIEDAFKVSPHANGPMIHVRLLTKIDAANCQLPAGEKLVPPSLRTMYRMLSSMDAYQQIRLQEGKVVADKRFRLVKKGVQSTNILERVEIDHTPLDLFLIDEKTWLPLGRPTLTVVIDHFSRMLLGFYLSYNGPSTNAVIGALRHAILPKQPVTEVLPYLHIEHLWPCYGVPDEMVVDNGLEFHGNSLDSVAFDLGSRIQYCPKHEPRFKGSVERYLKTINYFFAHQLPGTSLARLSDRGDYDPSKHALLTLAEFNHIFQKWVLDVYAQTIHRSLHVTPWTRWQDGMQRREPELPASVQTLQQRIGEVDERALRHDGILLHGIRYNGDMLEPILRAYGPTVKVRVLYNSEDLGNIYVWGPDQTEPVCVPALDQGYARGLTLRQNDLIQTMLRDKGLSSQNSTALRQARQDIVQAIDALLGSRKQRDRHRAAALLGLSSSKPNGSPPSPNKGEASSHTEPSKKRPQKLSRLDPSLDKDDSPKVFFPILRSGDLGKEDDK
jgi:putative transposase